MGNGNAPEPSTGAQVYTARLNFFTAKKEGKGRECNVPLVPATEGGANFEPSPSPACRVGSPKFAKGAGRGRMRQEGGPILLLNELLQSMLQDSPLTGYCGVGRDRVRERKMRRKRGNGKKTPHKIPHHCTTRHRAYAFLGMALA